MKLYVWCSMESFDYNEKICIGIGRSIKMLVMSMNISCCGCHSGKDYGVEWDDRHPICIDYENLFHHKNIVRFWRYASVRTTKVMTMRVLPAEVTQRQNEEEVNWLRTGGERIETRNRTVVIPKIATTEEYGGDDEIMWMKQGVWFKTSLATSHANPSLTTLGKK